jgi:hypothetical protein
MTLGIGFVKPVIILVMNVQDLLNLIVNHVTYKNTE